MNANIDNSKSSKNDVPLGHEHDGERVENVDSEQHRNVFHKVWYAGREKVFNVFKKLIPQRKVSDIEHHSEAQKSTETPVTKFSEEVQVSQEGEPNMTDNGFSNAKFAWYGERSIAVITASGLNLYAVLQLPHYILKYGALLLIIPCALWLLLVILPLYYMQWTLGQYSGLTVFSVWHAIPLMQGIGFVSTFILLLTLIYYSGILSWCIYFMFYVFTSMESGKNSGKIRCQLFWQKVSVLPEYYEQIGQNEQLEFGDDEQNCTGFMVNRTAYGNKYRQLMLPFEITFHEDILGLTTSIQTLGNIPSWQIVICLLAVWLLAFLCTLRGATSAAKISIVAIIVIILIHCALLIYLVIASDFTASALWLYFKPRWGELATLSFYADTILITFYQCYPAWAIMTTLGSHARFHKPFTMPILSATIFGFIVSFCVALIPVMLLAVVLWQDGTDFDSEMVKTDGPYIIFTVAMEAFYRINPSLPIWGYLYFLEIFLIGFTTFYWLFDITVCGFMDFLQDTRKTWLSRLVVQIVLILAGLIIAMLTITQGGMYVIVLLEWYIGRPTMLVLGFIECMAFAWSYGTDRLLTDMHFMTHELPWHATSHETLWKVITPTILLLATIYSTLSMAFGLSNPHYITDFPNYAITIGYLLAFSPLLFIVLLFIPPLVTSPGFTLKEVLMNALQSDIVWMPAAATNERPANRIDRGTQTSQDASTQWDENDFMQSQDAEMNNYQNENEQGTSKEVHKHHHHRHHHKNRPKSSRVKSASSSKSRSRNSSNAADSYISEVRGAVPSLPPIPESTQRHQSRDDELPGLTPVDSKAKSHLHKDETQQKTAAVPKLPPLLPTSGGNMPQNHYELPTESSLHQQHKRPETGSGTAPSSTKSKSKSSGRVGHKSRTIKEKIDEDSEENADDSQV